MSMVNQPLAREPVEPRRGRFRFQDVQTVWGAQKGLCATCGTALLGTFHADHVLAVELDGKTVLSNLQLLCVPCHKIKTARDTKAIRKAQRLERDHNPETRRRSKRPMRSRGFDKDPLR